MDLDEVLSYVYLAAAGVFWGIFLVLLLMTYVSDQRSKDIGEGGVGVLWFFCFLPMVIAFYLVYLAISIFAR